jgi:hypothetical protein
MRLPVISWMAHPNEYLGKCTYSRQPGASERSQHLININHFLTAGIAIRAAAPLRPLR